MLLSTTGRQDVGYDVSVRDRAACSCVAQGTQNSSCCWCRTAALHPQAPRDPQACLTPSSQLVSASSTSQERVTGSLSDLHHVVELVHCRARCCPAVEQRKALRLPVLVVHLRRLVGRRGHVFSRYIWTCSPLNTPLQMAGRAATANPEAAKTPCSISKSTAAATGMLSE